MRRPLISNRRLSAGSAARLLLGISFFGVSSHGAQPLANWSGLPVVRTFPLQQIGAQDNCWTAIQAPDGTLYFGSDKVIHYDGARWTTHSAGRATAILSFAFDDHEALWVGGANDLGYFPITNGQPGEFVSLASHLPPEVQDLSRIWNVVCRGAETVFVTNSQILRWNGRTFKVWTYPGSRRLSAMLVDNRIYISSVNLGLSELRGDALVNLISPERKDTYGITWVEKEDEGLLVCGFNGIFHLRNGTVTPAANGVGPTLASGILASVTRLSPDIIAAGTINRGIILFDSAGATRREFSQENGFPTRFANHLLLDRDNSLWTASSKSIYQIPHPLSISLFNEVNGFSKEPVNGISASDAGIAVATNEGVFNLLPGRDGPPAHFAAEPDQRMYSLDVERVGGDLLAARIDGVFATSEGKTRQIFSSPSEVQTIFRSRLDPAVVYLANSSHLVRLTRRGDGEYRMDATLDSEVEIHSFVEDDDGRRWIASHAGGVLFAAPGDTARFQRPGEVSGLPKGVTSAEIACVGGQVLALTNRGAFFRRDNSERFEPVPELDGFDWVKVSKQDSSGTAWLAMTPRTESFRNVTVLAHLRPADGHRGIGIDWYEVPELATTGTVRSLATSSQDGVPTLWIGATSGILRLDLGRLVPAQAPRAPELRCLFANGSDGKADARLRFSENRLTFEFASTEYARSDSLRYQTRLAGLEREWSAPTDTVRREYPYLQDASYRFEVRAVSPAGIAGPPAAFAFTILPPWYRTGWAYAAYVIAGGMLLFGGDRLRISAMRRRTRWLEEQVRARTVELEKANAAKTEFVARINHDIRNPINGVLGLTMTLEQTALSDEQQRLTGTIKQCAKFLASLVDEVLDFAEIESGGIKLRTEPFSLEEAIAAAVATIEPLASSAGCELDVRLNDRIPPRLSGDPARLQQILVNFLSNAVKFGAGAPILVSADGLHQMSGRVVVRIGVRDHGPGLTADEQQQLFRKFSRGRFAEEQKIKGTGLGLAVCRLLAERMGGRVGVESTPGNGSEFFMELPFEIDTATAEPVPSPVATNARVLVVEDEEYNAVSLISMLRRMGFQVDRCADGVSALDLLRRNRYQIVFLDWELPQLNGIEVARRFRAEEPTETRTLIIATTAYASSDKRQACRDAGMDEFVAKPLTPERITAAIRGRSGVFSTATSILMRDEQTQNPHGINLSLFSYLAESEDEIGVKVHEFIEACEAEMRELEQLIQAGRGDDLRQAAHRFLSQCRFVGASGMAELAVRLEKNAYDALSTETRRTYVALRDEFADFKNKLLSSLPAQASGSIPSQ